MTRDPVCGMEIDEETAEYRSTYQGKTYFFCSRVCKEEFDRDPADSLSRPAHCPVAREK